MGTLRMLWFFLWRTALRGAALSAALLAAAVFALAIVNFVYSDASGDAGVATGLVYLVAICVLFGALGAAVGFVLGLLCGLVLSSLTSVLYHPRPADPARYRRAAGWTCAAVAALALMTDWLLNGYPNPYDFALQRLLQEPFVIDVSAVNVFLLVIVPTLLFSLAAWLSGRNVAGRYVREASSA